MNRKNGFSIRQVQKKDLPDLINLCSEHAQYEQAEYDEKNKAISLEKYLFSNPVALHCLVVEKENALIGYATFMKQFSTWKAAYYVYLDCLYLRQEYRGMKIGTRLMKMIAAHAQSNHIGWVEWQTPVFKKSAIVFYNKLHAKSSKKERFVWEPEFENSSNPRSKVHLKIPK